jgi:deazaflavin-dependent oxidoreductase (nitroreductase family)
VSSLSDWTRRLGGETPSPAAFVHAIDEQALDNEVGFAAAHTRRYIATNGEDDGWDGPRPILILYTMGRKSGQVRRNPLLYHEHDGERLVVGSKGGDPAHPAWYLNLIADPSVHVRVMAEVYAATAEVLTPSERAEVWPRIVAGYPMFAGYQKRTEREIPIVRLVPVVE